MMPKKNWSMCQKCFAKQILDYTLTNKSKKISYFVACVRIIDTTKYHYLQRFIIFCLYLPYLFVIMSNPSKPFNIKGFRGVIFFL